MEKSDFFNVKTVEDVLEYRNRSSTGTEKLKVVDVSADTSIEQVLTLLNQQNILSVPVYAHIGSFLGAGMTDTAVDVRTDKEYIGISSILDICHFLFRADFKSVLGLPIKQTLGQTDESASLWVTVPETPILDALEPLTKSVHRMLVACPRPRSDVDDDKEAATIVEYQMLTQTDFVRFLYANLTEIYKQFPQLKSQHLIDLELVPARKHERSSSAVPYDRPLVSRQQQQQIIAKHGGRSPKQKKMISIWDSTLVIDALRILCTTTGNAYSNRHLNSLPIVDPIGDRVVGTFSVSDLRSLTVDKMERLAGGMTVGNYLRWVYQIESFDDLAPPRSCYRSWTLEQVMECLLQTPVVHRLWVVESESEFEQNNSNTRDHSSSSRVSSGEEDVTSTAATGTGTDDEDEEFMEVDVSTGKVYQTSSLVVRRGRSQTQSAPERLCGVISLTDVLRVLWRMAIKKEHLPKHNVIFTPPLPRHQTSDS